MLVKSQFDVVVGHYMFLNEMYNPAAVGSQRGIMEVTAAHRISWVGVPNAPQTTFFQFQLPFSVENTEHASGIRFVNDKIGLFQTQSAMLQYNYRFDFAGGGLSVGVDLGLISVGFDGDSIRDVKSDYHEIMGDSHIPQSFKQDMSFDLGAGIYYSHVDWYAGVSYAHLTNPKLEWGDDTQFTINGVMYFTGGCDFRLNHPLFTLKPSALIKTDFASWQMDLSILIDYDEKYRGGLSYRYQDALSVLLGMDVIDGLMLGYVYDVPVGGIGGWGSHEVYMSYAFSVLKQKKNSKYRNVRIL